MSSIDDIRDRMQWLAQGREIERGAIVADLRILAASYESGALKTSVDPSRAAMAFGVLSAAADRYERGEHLKEADHG